MSLLQNSNAIPASGDTDFYTHQIANSVRMTAPSSTSSSNARLTQTFSTVDSNVHWTLNFWIKRSAIEGSNPLSSARPLDVFTPRSGTSGSVLHEFLFAASGSYGAGDAFAITNTNTGAYILSTNNVFRDTSAFYNIHIQADLDNGTANEKLKIFINGTEADYNVDNRSSYSSMAGIVAGAWTIGDYYGYGYPIQSYLAQWAYVDGSTLAHSVFIEEKNGVKISKDLSSGITWGSAGQLLMFEDSSALGDDTSGEGNDWTSSNLSTHDQTILSPTFGSSSSGNFPLWSPLFKGATSLSEGNTRMTGATNERGAMTSWAIATGTKFYIECLVEHVTAKNILFGIANPDIDIGSYFESDSSFNGILFRANNSSSWDTCSLTNGSRGSFGSNVGTTAGRVLAMTVNRVDNEIKMYLDNSLKHTISISATEEYHICCGMGGGADSSLHMNINAGHDSTGAGDFSAGSATDENGYGSFQHAPASGFLALCSGNLSAAGADPAQEKQPINNYFQAVTYTGTGANGRSLTTKLKAASFWGKNRTTGAATPTRWWNTTGNNFGTGTELYVQFDIASYGTSSSTYQGVSNPQDTSITIGNVGYINVGSSSYVAYLFGVAGASAVTDTSGDIDSVRFTDADAGISIMDYTGSGTNGHTVPHGLGVKPSFVIIKNSTDSNSSSWRVWSDAFGDFNDYAVMDTNAAWQTSSGIFTADPTTTMLPLASGATQNNSSQTYMAWVFANTEGMVKAGTYEGNGGDADAGTFLFLGLKPAWFMIKDADNANNWIVYDNAREPFNVMDTYLNPDTNGPEESGNLAEIAFLSNGVKFLTDHVAFNGSGRTYVYLAFAEMPFKYATAR